MSETVSKNLSDLVMSFVERTKDGQIDVQRTQLNFTSALQNVVASERDEYFIIGKAIRKVFELKPEIKKIAMGALVHYAMQNLHIPDYDKFNATKEKVTSYIRNNPQMFKITSGKGGGVMLVNSDKFVGNVYQTEPPPSRAITTLRSFNI